jgi:hypothetical protein
LMEGMVQPLSLFLRAILEEYGLLLSQLHQNSLMALSIFQYLCKAFVGVHPSVALFRHYYNVMLESGGAISSGFTFRLHDGRGRDYINMSTHVSSRGQSLMRPMTTRPHSSWMPGMSEPTHAWTCAYLLAS